jgi:hypothetical protein
MKWDGFVAVVSRSDMTRDNPSFAHSLLEDALTDGLSCRIRETNATRQIRLLLTPILQCRLTILQQLQIRELFLQRLYSRITDRVGNLRQQQLAKSLASAMDRLANPIPTDLLAELFTKRHGHLVRAKLRMLRPEAKHVKQRLAGSRLMIGQRRPRSIEKLLPPGHDPFTIERGGVIRGRDRFWRLVADLFLEIPPLSSMPVDDEMPQDSFHEVAESTAIGTGAGEFTSQDLESKLLGQIRGDVRIAGRCSKKSLDGGVVSGAQFSPGRD